MQSVVQKRTGSRLINRLSQVKELGILAALAIMCVIIGTTNPAFFSAFNLFSIGKQTSLVAIIGVGMTFVIITGGIDLSVGSVMGLGGIVTAIMLKSGMPIPIGILGGMLTGTVIGFFNGHISKLFGIPPLITTLGTMNIARGLIYVLTRGIPVYGLPEAFFLLGQGDLLGVPWLIIIAVAISLVGHFILSMTTYGRALYATGGNSEAARLAGMDVERIKVSTFVIVSTLAALSGILLTSRLSSGEVTAGIGWEMDVVAAVIIGGTSLFGGSGTILGTVLGAAIMSVLRNGMVLMRVSVYWQTIIIGFVIILAVAVDQFRRRRASQLVA
jgi:ribose/xylose/arabinose/galactoside ABC-type transport system permease subunit